MRGISQRRALAGLCLLLVWQAGCAAFHPMKGIPARYLPDELKLGGRSARRTIDLSLLRQPWSPHLIDTGDVLGVYIEGVVGKASDPPPVHFPVNNDAPPSFGLPFPVRDDGTISLPLVGAINLRGLSIAQAEQKVTDAYLKPKQYLKDDNLRIQVNLQRPRQYRVLVIRQDSRNEPQPNAFIGQMNIGMVKRGTGKIVNLPAYSNDVLNALTSTDGLPGLDAENAVYVIRRRGQSHGGATDPNWPLDFDPATLIRQSATDDRTVIRGQSPDGNSEYLHAQDAMQPPNPNQSSYATQFAPGAGYEVYPSPMGGTSRRTGSMPSAESLQPPLVWPVRTAGSFDASTSGPGSYVVEASAAFPNYYPPTTTGMSPTPIGASSGGYPINPYAAQGPMGVNPGPSYPMQGSPIPPSAAPAYPTQAYPAQGYTGNGYPMQGYPNPNYPAQSYPPQSYSVQSQPVPNGASFTPSTDSFFPGSGAMNPSFGPSTRTNVPPGIPQGTGPAPIQAVPYGGQPPVVPDLRPQLDPRSEINPGHVIVGNGALDGRHVVRIPIRLGPGETADIRPEDVILHDGDIVFIESRETEVFYTGGLLGGGQYMLPRDYDLDILQALSLAQSRQTGMINNAIGGVSALNNDVSISPSTAIVLRKLPGGGEVPVKVNLYRARDDLSERIIIQPGDFILLQYTPLEAIAAFFERHLLETALFGLAAQQFNRPTTN